MGNWTQKHDHNNASRLVRFWRAQPAVRDPYEFKSEDEYIALVFPGGGYLVRVTFSKVVDHPEWMWIRSTNWRTEHEPRGIFKIEDARAFYKELKAAGFVEEGKN